MAGTVRYDTSGDIGSDLIFFFTFSFAFSRLGILLSDSQLKHQLHQIIVFSSLQLQFFPSSYGSRVHTVYIPSILCRRNHCPGARLGLLGSLPFLLIPQLEPPESRFSSKEQTTASRSVLSCFVANPFALFSFAVNHNASLFFFQLCDCSGSCHSFRTSGYYLRHNGYVAFTKQRDGV